MAREGAAVVVADRDAVAGEATARTIVEGGGLARAIAADVADAAALERLVAGTIAAYGRIDILHSHAGIQVEGPLDRGRSRGDGGVVAGQRRAPISG